MLEERKANHMFTGIDPKAWQDFMEAQREQAEKKPAKYKRLSRQEEVELLLNLPWQDSVQVFLDKLAKKGYYIVKEDRE